VTANGAGKNVELRANGGDLSVDNVTLDGSSDLVTLNASGAIREIGIGDAAADITAGSLDATAGSGIDLDTNIVILANADGGTGAIDIADASALAVTSATTTGSITLSAGGTAQSLTIDNVSGGGTVTLTASGAIVDDNVAGTNVTAGSLSATASSGIDLDTDITTLTLADGGTGAIDIEDVSALAVTSATTTGA
ncbi:unnamed protein product, partial [Phaeothamnion confervicola]